MRNSMLRLWKGLRARVFFLMKNISQQEKNKGNRIFGRSKGRYTLAPDFDAPLDDFKEYM